MADVQVMCTTKSQGLNHHEAITHLGAPSWYWTKQEVISSIENKTNTFYTLVGGTRANVGVVQGERGKYLRTHADGKWNDNLLALPPCNR